MFPKIHKGPYLRNVALVRSAINLNLNLNPDKDISLIDISLRTINITYVIEIVDKVSEQMIILTVVIANTGEMKE